MSSPPQDSNDSSDSPPPPPSSSPPPSSNSQPPPNNPSPSPPPPNSSSPSPPPPPPNNSSPSPPPPSNSPSTSRPPPPNNSSPPPHNNNNNNRSQPPPPSSHSRSFSPPPPRNNNSQSNDNSSQNQNNIIIEAAAGVGLLFFIMIVFIVACARRKRRKPHDHMNYYRDNSFSDYYNSGPGKNWPKNTRPPNDHALPMPPHPGSAQVSSELNWPIKPPPPPPMMSSSELSSAGFSGPYQAPQPPPHPAMALGFNQSSFTYNDLAVATSGFSQANLLGQGGFGYVHKGVLPNGKQIAVKSLKANSGQGEREFQAEVDIISRVHHRHLVSLVGYCIAGSQRMLVYEFVPNGTLEYHLHGANRPTMDWSTRLKIALGMAKGFAYLHEDCHPRIIHRDIKTANILLDYNFEAKVADFGLAKLSSDNNTHVSTRIMGTFGYLAPEYASSGKLTEKSDVYSYGIMLLEFISGRRPIDMTSDEDNLVDWAKSILIKVIDGGSYEELVDPGLENNYNQHEMLRMVYCAAACIRHSARRRPKMSQIVRALEGDVSLESLNDGVKSGQSAMYSSSNNSSDHSDSYPDLKIFRNTGGISSQEFTSSELIHSNKGKSQEIGNQGIHTTFDRKQLNDSCYHNLI